MRTLSSLLDARYEDVTFHDSELLSFTIDFARASATFEFDLQCRATVLGQQFSLQRGAVEFSGLCFFAVEPVTFPTRPDNDSSLWITADGSLPDERLQLSNLVPTSLSDGAFVHYLYSNSTNSFIVIGATNAVFNWKD